jgi:hypothetical protein
MRERVLKAVASPPKFLWAPYQIAAASLILNFIIYIIYALIKITVLQDWTALPNPLWLLLGIVMSHLGIVAAGKKEPHLSSILKAKLSLKNTKNLVKSKGNKYLP